MNAQAAPTTTRIALNLSVPSLLLRAEGLVAFIAALIVYGRLDGSWLLFIVLLFVPDVSGIGYLRNPHLGSITYNIAHAYLLPVLLIALGIAAQSVLATQIGVIWFAHISMDRTMGYGLRYAQAFKSTHLQRV